MTVNLLAVDQVAIISLYLILIKMLIKLIKLLIYFIVLLFN